MQADGNAHKYVGPMVQVGRPHEREQKLEWTSWRGQRADDDK